MPLFSIFRFFGAIASLAILAAAGWLLWTWYDGEFVRHPSGSLYLVREEWRLWTGLGLLAWSFLGGRILPLLIARADTRPTHAERGEGRLIPSPTGSTLYVESLGRAGAPVILFTHGWGMDSTFWSYARQDLAGRFRLVLWDLPGLGRSRPATPAAISLETFARDLETVMEECGPGRVVLVGHSIGGMTLQTLIRDRPGLQDRISGLVLLNTTYTNPLRTMLFSRLLLALQKPLLEPASKLTIALTPLLWLTQWQSYFSGQTHFALRFGCGPRVTRSQLEHIALLATRNSPGAQARGDLAMFHWDATGALAKLRVPALVIGGGIDIVTKPEASRVMAAEDNLANLVMVKDANHMGPMEQAELYNSHIADFALRLLPAAGDRIGASPRADREPPVMRQGPQPGA